MENLRQTELLFCPLNRKYGIFKSRLIFGNVLCSFLLDTGINPLAVQLSTITIQRRSSRVHVSSIFDSLWHSAMHCVGQKKIKLHLLEYSVSGGYSYV